MSSRRYLALAALFAALSGLIATSEAESGLLGNLQAAMGDVHPIAHEAHALSDQDLALIAGVWQSETERDARR